MSDQRVFAEQQDSTGTALDHQAKIHGIHAHLDSAGVGQIVLRDGGGSGTVVATFDTPAVNEPYYIPIPGHLVFDTDVHVTLTNVNEVTLLWSN